MKRSSLWGLLGALALVACSTVVIDPSVEAVEAGDYTLAMSACDAVPGGGMDICRVHEGDPIESSWKMVVPTAPGVLAGEVDVYYRDIHHSYPVTGALIEVPWKDFFNSPNWTSEMDGEALALVVIRWKDKTGVEKLSKFRGIAKIVVTKEGYDRMPIDSGFAAFQTTCKIAYSTAGRGAIKCK